MGDFGAAGYCVLAIYMAASVFLGLSFAKKQKNLAGYFLAERSAPWWAVGISVLACDFSAISFIGAPAWSYNNDLRFPMVIFMCPLVAVVVAYLFIPFLVQLKVYSIYEYLEHRFGLRCRLFASTCFMLLRAAHIAVAVYAVSLVLQKIVDLPVMVCILIIGSLTTLYTVLGGMKAVLWTDVMQFFVMVASIATMAGVVLWTFRGDAGEIWRVAAAAGHTKIVSAPLEFWKPGFWMEMTLWGVLVTAVFGRLGSYGSDQVLVQRYLAAGSARKMAKSLIFCGLLTLPVGGTLYLLGLGFFAFYHRPENAALFTSLGTLVAETHDQNMVLPHFVRYVLPSGVAGLVFAGLFAATMSVFSSGLNSLSTVTCIDFVKRLRRPGDGEVTLRHARRITLAWGVAVTAGSLCVYVVHGDMLMRTIESIIGFFSGPVLGMFLLGILTRRANSFGAILGALAGFATTLFLRHRVEFIWYAAAGCVPTVIIGYLISMFAPPRPIKEVYPLTLWGRHTADKE
jgi:SSS family transporter